MKYILLSLLCFSCSDEPKNTKSIYNQIQDQDSLTMQVESPSGDCKYFAVLYENGLVKVNSSEYLPFEKVLDKKEKEKLNKIFKELIDVNYSGKVWNDGWKYEIYFNSERKILSYNKADNAYTSKVIELIESMYLKEFIDYSCF